MVIRITLPAGYQGGQEQDTMRQYVQTDREVHRQVTTALAELILGGVMPALENPPPQRDAPIGLTQGLVDIRGQKSPEQLVRGLEPLELGSGAGFEPATSGL